MLKMDCQSMPLVRVLRNTADPQDNGCPVIVVLPSDSKCRCISAVRSPADEIRPRRRNSALKTKLGPEDETRP